MKQRTLCAALLFGFIGALWVMAAPPNWWSDRGVVTGESNPLSPATLGQLKNMAHRLHDELEAELVDADGAGFELSELFFAPPENPTAEWYEQQKKIVNLGQLKHVASRFYDRLNAISPAWVKAQIAENDPNMANWPHPYPWNPNTPNMQNYQAANIGQLKMVFSLRIKADGDNDGFSDLKEYLAETDPNDSGDFPIDPSVPDADNDGLLDVGEESAGQDDMIPDHPIVGLKVR